MLATYPQFHYCSFYFTTRNWRKKNKQKLRQIIVYGGIHDIFPTTTKKNANIRYSFKLQILFDRAADKTYIGGHGYYNCVQ
jgi:hypothetical protein